MPPLPGADPDQILTDAQLKCQAWGKIQLGSGGAVSPPVGPGQGHGGGTGGKAPGSSEIFSVWRS